MSGASVRVPSVRFARLKKRVRMAVSERLEDRLDGSTEAEDHAYRLGIKQNVLEIS